jgi:amidophosphoribosyltransferase
MKGIIGVYSKSDAALESLYLLYGVQHRGQESAGISAGGDRSLRTWKGKGLVSSVFNDRYTSFIHPDDYVAIGCASGENADRGILPPFNLRSERYELSIITDGHVLGSRGRPSDEVLGEAFYYELEQHGSLQAALQWMMRKLTHAYYSLVMAVLDKEENHSKLVVARDPRGVRPLYMGWNEDALFVASESAPIDVMEGMGEIIEGRRDIKPGSMVVRDEEGVHEEQILDPMSAHCAFEWVYFGRPDSVFEGRSVHDVRRKLGHALVETHSLRRRYGTEEGPRDDIVLIPVPDSGRSVCIGVSEGLGVPANEGVIKNAYLGRTYIIDDPVFRKTASDLKHNVIRETVEGKRVVITDDSIVRGTVSESVAQNLLKAGATEVEFLVSYAPIFHPCFHDPEDKPLTASLYKGRSLTDIGDLVAANLPSINKVRYNSPENVVKAIGLSETDICTLCIGGINPFRVCEKGIIPLVGLNVFKSDTREKITH